MTNGKTEVLKRKAHDERQTPPGRWPAGEDPVKRQQIIDGAREVFQRLGFDAASMNDIAREAGVSKGTLYVYFANKEDLFTAMLQSARAQLVAATRDALNGGETLEDSLLRFGRLFVTFITRDENVAAMRMVIGVRERMPDVCRRFFTGQENVKTVLCDFFMKQVESGALAITDFDVAAGHFLDLTSGSFFKLRLFGDMDAPPSADVIETSITNGMHVFLSAYGTEPARTQSSARLSKRS